MTAPALGRLALIVNPAATRATRRAQRATCDSLTHQGLEWAHLTTGPGQAADLARQAVDQGASVVAVLAGDGAVSDVAAALADTGATLAPLPGGNANVFARALGWSNRLATALAEMADSLAAGRVRDITMGHLEAGEGQGAVVRHFSINAGLGLDAAAVDWIEQRPQVKRRLRHAGYVLGAAVATTQARRGPTMHITPAPDPDPDTDPDDSAGAPDPFDARALIVATGDPYTYLGTRPLPLIPNADFAGPPAWLAASRVPPRGITTTAARALSGRAPRLPHPDLRAGLLHRPLLVTAEHPFAVQADGEPLGTHLRAILSSGPTLRVLIPRGRERER